MSTESLSPEALRDDLERLATLLAANDDLRAAAQMIAQRHPKPDPQARARLLQYDYRRLLGEPVDEPPPGWTDPDAWPPGTLGHGLFSALAQLLGDGDAVAIQVERRGGHLTVAVTPQLQSTGTLAPLHVEGTPVSLDTDLPRHLPGLAPALSTVAGTLAQYRARVIAQARRQTGMVDAEGLPKGFGQLHLNFTNDFVHRQQAHVTVTGGGQHVQVTADRLPLPLPAGRHTVHVVCGSYAPYTTQFDMTAGAERHLDVTLRPDDSAA